jgi:hypothetical protein
MDELLMNYVFAYLMVWVIVAPLIVITNRAILDLNYLGFMPTPHITLSIILAIE